MSNHVPIKFQKTWISSWNDVIHCMNYRCIAVTKFLIEQSKGERISVGHNLKDTVVHEGKAC